jgi:osmotically inducible protein OsmC
MFPAGCTARDALAKNLYNTDVSIAGGRDGSARPDDGKLAVSLPLPEAICGSGNGTNPEQSFQRGLELASHGLWPLQQKG